MGTGEDQKLAAIVPRNYCTREIGARQEESAKAAPDGRSCDVKGAYTRPCKVPVDEQRPKASLVLLCRGFRVRLSVAAERSDRAHSATSSCRYRFGWHCLFLVVE